MLQSVYPRKLNPMKMVDLSRATYVIAHKDDRDDVL